MQQLLSSLEEERQRQFRRFVAISAGVHVTLAVLFWIGPIRPASKGLPVVERVALVPTLPAPPAAKPAAAKPKPAPVKPAPPPPPPPEAKKVLPKQPAPLPKPKPEAKAKPEVKPKPEAKPEPKPAEPEPEQDLDDVLDSLRKEAGETAPRPVSQQAAAVGPAGGPGIVDPELARWIREVKIHVTRAWVLAPEFRNQPLETLLMVEVGPTGEVGRVRITESSGNPWYDESVERALQKATPLPVPPRADDFEFSFRPDDAR